GRCPGREDQGRDRSRQAQGPGRRVPEDHRGGGAAAAAARARIDHHGQHQGPESLERSQLPGGELVRHMAAELAPGKGASSRQLAALNLLRRRLIQAVPLILGVVVINFCLIQLAPGSFLELMTAENQVSDPATIELLRKTYGLDDPVWLQLLKYIWALLHFDFGFSYRQNMPVIDAVS